MTLEPLHIPELLARFNLQPQKSLGQNFLVDHNALLKIVRDAAVSGEDHVLEIGAGLGSLTRVLATKAKSVTAVEIDANLFPALKAVTQPFPNIRLIQADILKLDLDALFPGGDYLVVANIPYYITSAVIRHLLEAEVKPTRLVLTMQKEVAERILSRNEKMSLLSLSVQVYGQPSITTHLPAACFHPRPRVDSSVLLIDVHPEPLLSDADVNCLFDLAHAAFNQKRKMLRNSLKPVLGVALNDVTLKAGVDPTRRPENLTLEEWIRLTRAAAGGMVEK